MSEATVARTKRFVDPQRVQRRLKAADFVVLLVATMGVFLGSSLWIPAHAVSAIGFFAFEVAFGSVLMMSWIGLYELDCLLDLGRGIVSALAVTVGLGAIAFLITHLGLFALEPLWLSGWGALCAVHFALTRTAAFLWARPKAAAGAFRQRVAVVGWGEDADDAIRLLAEADPLRLEVVGLFDDRGTRAGPGVGAMAELVGAAKAGLIDLIVVAIPLSAEHRLLQSLKKLWPLPVDIRIARQPSDIKLSPRAYGYLGKLPLLSVFDRPLKCRRRAKGLLDRALAALLGLVVLPVALLAALAIRLEGGGPVLVRERHHGFDGREIAVYRFRCGSPPTPVGRALRKLRLDGLPQLVNVLKGDLSLVGPRPRSEVPTAAGLYSQVIDGYFARHAIKPGITGWAQINGWADAMEKTSKHDLEYVDRWSLFFDLYILFKAPFALLRRRAAA
jgi:lipopolysaccharide/colanic/teichoic acid biosynthesis glycosyltransferase